MKSFFIGHNCFVTILVLVTSLTVSNLQARELIDLPSLLTFEIEGVSLSTEANTIPDILQGKGYKQTQTTYTKQHQVLGQRKSIYRIEINEEEAGRHIIYIREKSGGRIKSPPKQEKPIPPNEASMAKKLYELVCIDPHAQLYESRACLPITTQNISFGHGKLVAIGKNISVKLSASAASTAIEVRYSEY